MIRHFKGASVLLVLGCSMMSVAPAADGLSKPGKAESGTIETRVLVHGDAYLQLKKKMLQGVSLSDPFVSEIHYPANWDWSTKGSIMNAEVDWALAGKSASSKDTTYPNPVEPTGDPPFGTQITTGLACAPRRTGPGFGDVTFGNLTWYWEYDYRVDSDGNGEKDSDPGWYLTKEEFAPYQATPMDSSSC